MTQLISVGTKDHAEYLKAKLFNEIKLLQEEGIRIDLDETQKGDLTFLDCTVIDYGTSDYSEENAQTIFRHYLANVVSDLIINNWEEELLQDIIDEECTTFNKDEQKSIFEGALRQLNNGDTNDDNFILYKISRKSKILQSLLEYLYTNENLIIEGFIKFRLRDYLEELHKSVNVAIDEYLLEKEYREFIRLLKYFVDIQEPRMDEVHVVVLATGSFRLLDSSGKNLNNELLDGFMVELSESELNYEDILISSLISIAPRSIVLHPQEKVRLVNMEETVNNVFGERVRYCDGCKTCRKFQNIER